jgi:Carboxypeptidase regulatory-like domain
MGRRILLLVVSLLLLLVSANAPAQFAQRGGVEGNVYEPSGAVVPGAQITLLNIGMADIRHVKVDSAGHFEFDNIVAGQYRLTVVQAGFETSISEPITVNLGAIVHYDFKLRLGKVQESVTVTGDTTGIETDSIRMGTNVTTQQFEELPLNGRNFTQIAALAPGVATSPQANAGGNQTWAVGAQYAMGGTLFSTGGTFQGARDNGFYVNGVNINDNYMSSTNYQPSPEALGTGTVQVSDYSAVTGHDVSALIMQTKGGTSSFHGEAYEFLENTDLNAMTAGVKFEDILNNQTPSVPILHRNQFGGNLGGPIYFPKLLPKLRDKLFFFANYEKFIEHDGNSLVEASVPSAAERSGNFCELLYISNCANGDYSTPNGAPIQLYNPYTTTYNNGISTRHSIPNNRLDQATKPDGTPLVDPSSAAILNAIWPLPNVHGAPSNEVNYTTHTAPQTSEYHIDMRFDAKLTSNDSLFVTWSRSPGTRNIVGGMPPIQLYNFPTADGSYLVTANYVHVFSTNLTNEFIFGFGQGWLQDVGVSQLSWLNSRSNPFNTLFSNTGPGATAGVVALIVNKYAVPGASFDLQGWKNQTLQFSDNVNWVHGRHALSAGFNYLRKGEKDWGIGQSASFGSVSGFNAFSSSGGAGGYAGGDSMADLVMGLVVAMNPRFQMNGGDDFAPDGWLDIPYWGFYANDKFRLSPKLTISAGLRYELNLPIYAPDPMIEPCCQIYNAAADNGAGVMEIPGIAAGVPLHYLKASKIEFAPRVGISYTLSSQSVIRAGYGIFYDAGASQAATQFSGQSPTGSGSTTGSINFQVSNTTQGILPDLPNLTLANIFPAYVSQTLGNYPVSEGAGVGYFGNDAWYNNLPWGIWDQRSQLMPYYQRISLDFQQQVHAHDVVTLSYAGSQGRRGADEQNINLPPYQTGWSGGGGPTDPAFNSARPNNSGRWADLPVWRARNNSFYNAAIVQYRHDFSQGMQIISNYTFGKTISDYPSYLNSLAASSQAGGGSGFQYPSSAGPGLHNRGEATLSHRHRFVFSGIWAPTYGARWPKWANESLTRWRLAGIFTLESGDAETVINGGPGLCDGAICGTSPQDGAGFSELIVSGNANLSHAQKSFNHQFDISKFSIPPMGVRGNSGLGTIRGPGQDNLDLSLAKTFPIYERLNLEFRADFFNALNHTQWMGVNTTYPSGDPNHPFGRVATANTSWNTQYYGGSREARIGQLAAKLVF